MEQSILRADLHVHTSFSGDSRVTPADVVGIARRVGLDVLAITDHGTVRGSLEAERLARGDPLIIPGQEVRTLDGEVLVLGLREDILGCMPALETVREAKEKGGFIIIPHPFDPMRHGLGKALEPCLAYVDAIEAFNARTLFSRFNRKAMEYVRARGIPATVGSDSHFAEEMGKAILIIRARRDMQSIFRAILEGRAEPVISRQGRLPRLRRGLLKLRTYI